MDLPWLSSDETVTAWSRMSEERVEGVALCIQAARLESREKGNASMANSVQQSGDGAKKGKLAVLFEDLSIAQVIAGALAAATVFLLSSVIGVAGSLIGAAVGSIVSAVSSQVYKKMLSASADKIRDVAPDGASANQADPNETRLMEPVSSSETRVIDSGKVAASATKVMGADVRYQAHASSDKVVDPALQRAHVRRRRKARVQRSVIIVSIVSALIAIVVSAGLIHVFTDGQGIGEKTEPIFTASEASQAKQGSSAANGSTRETAANESTSSKSNEGSSQSGKSSSADSSNSSTSASGSGSGSGSSDSSASSNGGSSSSDSSSENAGSSSNPGSGSSGSGNSGSSSGNGSSGSGSSSGSSGSGSPSAGSGN